MEPDIKTLITAATATIGDNAAYLTELDQAIGDGDHGINMKRGFEAVSAQADELAALSLSAALQKAGMTLVMKVGGASGPLYGTLFMAMGKALPENTPDAAALAKAFAEAVAMVKKRGKSEVGEKTMLEVLAPVAETLQNSLDADVQTLLGNLRIAAEQGMEATREMQATKGRAAYLGERSIGHLDPGAVSSCLLVKAICDCMETKR